MEKRDLRKQYRHLYQPTAKVVELVDVPALQYAMIDGRIEAGYTPGSSPSFQRAMEALYGISYGLKFASKLRQDDPLDYKVMGLEALWWVEGGEFDITRPDNWAWTAMILQPDFISPGMFQAALAQEQLRLETFHEGLSIQVMHIGPYSAEQATIARMEAFARENGYRLSGAHHEIYMSDPRRGSPEKLKTVLRHPVKRAET